jgi:acyl-CoA hydrolase
MTTPVQQKIRNKTITAQKWASMVKSGDWLSPGACGSSAIAAEHALADRLGEGPGQIKDIEMWHYGYLPPSKCTQVDPEERYHVQHNGFYFPWARKQRDAYKTHDWIPWGWSIGTEEAYYRFWHPDKAKRALDWTVVSVSRPEGPYFNFSYGTCESYMLAHAAKKVVLEVREDFPWAEGGDWHLAHIDDVDYIIDDVDCEKYKWPQMPPPKASPAEVKIADHCLEIMQDGDCVQLGIGGLPSAVCTEIAKAGLKDLGIHTEMMQDGLMALIESGAVNNRMKEIDRGRSAWAFVFPFDSKKYYEMIHHNHDLAVYPVSYTNNWLNLSKISHMVAINNFIAVDFMGQLSCGHYANRPISGTGGFFQFVTGCALSKGGRGIATATSTRTLPDGKVVSRIVPTLDPHSSVDVPGQLASWVVTEYGRVNLWGCGMYERVQKLISIAHPDFREDLERQAREIGWVPKHFNFSLGTRNDRYPDYKERREFKIPFTGPLNGYTYTPDGSIFAK